MVNAGEDYHSGLRKYCGESLSQFDSSFPLQCLGSTGNLAVSRFRTKRRCIYAIDEKLVELPTEDCYG